MADTVFLTEPFTASVLFVSRTTGLPIVPTSPTVSIFYFDAIGTKVTLVNNAPMVPVNPPEVGRYEFVYTFSGTITSGTTAHVEYNGVDPGPGTNLFNSQTLYLTSRALVEGHLNTRFVS